jgi:phospholipase D1/2
VADRREGSYTENGTIKGGNDSEAAKRRPARGDEPFEKWEREAMEKLLGEVRGHLGRCSGYRNRLDFDEYYTVLFPSRFLEGEDVANNFLFNADRSVRLSCDLILWF